MVTYAAFYSGSSEASSARSQVSSLGIPDDDQILIGPKGSTVDEAMKKRSWAGAVGSYEKRLGKHIEGGGSALFVRAGFGSGRGVRKALDEAKPTKLVEEPDRGAQFFSDVIGLSLIWEKRESSTDLKTNAHPSRAILPLPLVSESRSKSTSLKTNMHPSGAFLPLPLVTSSKRESEGLGFGTLAKGHVLSNLFGLSMLTKSATPFSSMFGMKTVIRKSEGDE